MTVLEGRRGPSSGVAGQNDPVRIDKWGNLATSQGGRFRDAVERSEVFSGCTAVTGVAPGTAQGTTAAFALANPTTSTVNLVVLRVSMGYVSGTLGAGVVMYGSAPQAGAAVTGTAITVSSNLLGSTATNYGRAFTTATVVSPVMLRPFCSLGASLASTAVQPWQTVDEVNGEFVIYPGGCLTLHATAAGGSSPLVVFGASWQEVLIGA